MPFKPPTKSQDLLQGVPFDNATDTAPEAKERFDAFDETGTKDPNKCKALLQFPNGTVFWSSKMAVDADGPAAGPGRKKGKQLDPDNGQNDTSFQLPNDDGGLPAETVPYIAIPHDPDDKDKPFHPDIAIGDVAIVIYQDEIVAAICGDIGPAKKIGEGSIHVHEELMPRAPDPCRRNAKGFCDVIHDVSIDEDVLFFVFPHSRFGNELTLENIELKIKERAFARFNELKGIS
jgi:Fungal chitosanase of glycosyl hydrolase group 75